MNFLQHETEIRYLVTKIDRDGYNWGNSCIGDLSIELITEDEVHLNLRLDVEDGELTPNIIIKNTNNPDYPVQVLQASKNSIDTVNGYLLLTEPSIIHPCKTLREIFYGIRDWIYQ